MGHCVEIKRNEQAPRVVSGREEGWIPGLDAGACPPA